ncbi:MAG: tRNA-dihydrouridine synthase family protein [Lachnospiraceae bacterium]|nr:tRNA-dihydrouridine synthase family protein [Lachnospiraceae bacterium]
MQFYFAPMEGVTGYIYRNAFHNHFDKNGVSAGLEGTVARYYAPFISPGRHKKLTTRESSDLSPEHNQGISLVPQILTNDADIFLRTTEYLRLLGYGEVNLNLGCPSGTVVSKRKGAGMLEDVRLLDEFLEKIFKYSKLAISIKTRIGLEDTQEWYRLVDIFHKYPVKELIVHPRLGVDLYRGAVRMESFSYIYENTQHPLCYNGDIFTVQTYLELKEQFPKLQAVMLGRGLLTNPALIRQIHQGAAMNKAEFRSFHDEIFAAYEIEMSGDRNLLFKMKELWNYWAHLFEDGTYYLKKLRKTANKQEYLMIVSQILRECELADMNGSFSIS